MSARRVHFDWLLLWETVKLILGLSLVVIIFMALWGHRPNGLPLWHVYLIFVGVLLGRLAIVTAIDFIKVWWRTR